MYFVVDEFGNIIYDVAPKAGTNLDIYIGKQILVGDNIFGNPIEFWNGQRNTFLSGLRWYLSGIVQKPKVVTPKPIDPIGIVHPMYAVEPVKPTPTHPMYAVEPVKPIPIHPMYGVEPIDIAHPMYAVEPIEPTPTHPMYAVEPVKPIINPIDKPVYPIDPIGIAHPMYAIEPVKPIINPIDTPAPIDPIGIAHPMYAVEPGPRYPIDEPIPVGPEKPIEPGSVIDKIVTIEQLTSDRAELDNNGIKVVPEIKNEQKPFQDGSGKK